jgi:hypothetical protein
MIVMQYRFTLPADYDMAVIETRIRENGAKLDGFLACWLRRISFPGARTRIALRIATPAVCLEKSRSDGAFFTEFRL